MQSDFDAVENYSNFFALSAQLGEILMTSTQHHVRFGWTTEKFFRFNSNRLLLL